MSGLWPLVWRALLARPLRSVLTGLAVALGIATVLGVEMTMNALNEQAATAQTAAAGYSTLDVRVDAGSGLSSREVAALARLPHVASEQALYEKRVAAAPAGTPFRGATVLLVAVHDGTAALRPVEVISGRLPRAGAEIAIDAGLASSLAQNGHALQIGSRLQLMTATGPATFTVVGYTAGTSAGPAFTRSAVFADVSVVQQQFALGLRTPLVALRATDGSAASALAASVHQELGSAVTTFDPRVGAAAPLADLRPLLSLMVLLALLVGAGVSANSVALSALERRREMALLRAAGASATHVFRLHAAQAVIVIACATPVGTGLGLLLGLLLTTAFAPTGGIATAFSGGDIGVAIGTAGGAALAAALVPAFAAGRLSVVAALRAAQPARGGRAGRLLIAPAVVLLVLALACFVAGSTAAVAVGAAALLLSIACAMPVLVPPAMRCADTVLADFFPSMIGSSAAVERHRARAGLTASGLSVTIATAVAMSSLVAAALSAGDTWVSRLFAGDTLVRSSVTQNDAVQRAYLATPGVRTAIPLRFLAATVSSVTVGVTALDAAAYSQAGGLDVVAPSREQAFAALQQGNDVLAPQQLAAASGWSVGTVVPVQTPSGVADVTIAGIVSHSFPAGDGSESLIMSTAEARHLFGNAATGFDALVSSTDGSTAPVRAAADLGMQAVPVSSVAATVDSALRDSVGLLLALAVIAVAMSLIAIVNTLTVSIREGTRELALLRAVGIGPRRALRLVLVETVLLATCAAIVGVAAGLLLALPMLHASSSPGFTLAFAFPAVSVAAVVAAVMLAAIVAAAGPARRAAHTSVLRALHQE